MEYAEDLKDPAQVTVKARTVIDQEAVAAAVTQEVRCVLATTDTARQWSMAELWSTYHKQSAIERMWKISTDPSIMIDAAYLSSPVKAQLCLNGGAVSGPADLCGH